MFSFFYRKAIWLPILILVVMGSFVYSFNLNNGLFWDDDDWIINNNFVHAISWDNVKFWFTHNTLAGVGLKSNYYRPFLFLTFALNYIVDSIKPLVWHLTSNLLHIANGVLVFSILYLVLRSTRWASSKILEDAHLNWVAFLTALFFLIHPLQTEAVTYISGRGDLLTAFFMLLTLWLFIKSEAPPTFGDSISKSWRWKMLSLIFLILALLSRETAIIFPLLLVVFYVAFPLFPRFDLEIAKGRTFLKSANRCFIKTWPYFAVVIIYGILRLTVLNFQNTLNFYQQANIYSENLYIRIFTFMHVLAEYVRLLIWPTGLHMERSMTVHTSFFQWPVWGVFSVLVGLVIFVVYLYKKEHRSQSSKFEARSTKPETILNDQNSNIRNISNFRIFLFGFGWFFIGLAPVSGITPINAILYEHWLYLPMIGFWFIATVYIVKLFDYFKSKSLFTFYFLFSIFLIFYLSFFGYQSIKRNILWGNPEKFYQDILKHEPESVRINNNLGNLYFDQKNIEKAEEYYRRAIDVGDIFPQPHYNIGSILQSRGDISGAIEEYEKAIEIDPNFFYPYQNLAVIYAQRGDLPKAKENIEILKSLLPTNPRVFYNSALVYIALNNRVQAVADLKEGLRHSKLDLETGRLIEELINKLQK